MTVGEICNRRVVIAHKRDTILEAATRIRDFHVGTLVVVEDREGSLRVPVGILTDRDIVVGVLAHDGRHMDALELSELAQLVVREQKREREVRT